MRTNRTLKLIAAATLAVASIQASAITGEYFGPFSYQNVSDTQTIITWIDLNTQTVPYDGDYHLAFGARGAANSISTTLGRGITIGYVGQDHDGYPGNEVNCAGVMVEDFSKNVLGADGDPYHIQNRGLIPGTCHSMSFAPNTTYRVYVHVSKLNVYWEFYEYLWDIEEQEYIPELLAAGGCWESTGNFCPEHSEDGSYGEGFLLGTGVDTNRSWSYSNFGITHY